MDTNRLKKFASEARAILKRGVAAKMLSLGFDRNGHIDESEMPVLIQGGSIFRGQQHTEAFYHQWMSLHKRIEEKGIKEVYEEAAYTWFNRFIAIRILQKNGLAEPVLDFVDVARTPHIVDAARMGHHPQMSAADEELLRSLLGDVSAVTPQFSLLITAYCHNNPIIYKCFGGIADYTELLLPNDILAENGFIDTLNHTEFITDEDYVSPELIGWLYQFYISERKDEVFAKKGKFEADEIPAATQIFTPNWIVKYMVQNTVGRIYLDNNPWATDLKDKWQYLVEPSEPTPDEAKLKYKDLTELRVGDLACGSGHILNECFNLLFDLYLEDGYSRSEAIEAIFKYNLTGIDLDTRAKQLAAFALLLKACQRDSSFADAHVMPNILNMPEPQKDEKELTRTLHHFFKGGESRQDITSLLDAFKLMRDADSLGSVMIFDIPDSTRALIKQTVKYYDDHADQQEYFTEILPAMKLILALTEKYHALVMNPPYMGSGNMNEVLLRYVKQNYDKGKADLCTAFMLMQAERTIVGGFYANIIPPSWMFLSTFEGLRCSIVKNQLIHSLLHLSRGIFGADFGSVSTVIQNIKVINPKGTYFRLIERTFQEFDQKHLQQLFERTLANHNFRYYFAGYSKDVTNIEYCDNGAKTYYPKVEQQNFEKIPGCPIGYWVSENALICFSESNIDSLSPTIRGLQSGDVNYFSHMWYEVATTNIEWSNQIENNKHSSKEWCKFTNGGNGRKWYGNLDLVVKWRNNGQEIKETGKAIIPNEEMYFMSCAGYNRVTSNGLKARYYNQGILCGDNTPFSVDNGYAKLLVGLLNSVVSNYFISILNPTMAAQSGSVRQIPFVTRNKECVEAIIESNITLSKKDWDAHETSWDFKKNELLTMDSDTLIEHMDYSWNKVYRETGTQLCTEPEAAYPDSIEWCYYMYCYKWGDKFDELHRNEEELNRQFIEIYGLQDELTPEVPLNEITILQQGEISIENNELKWHPDVVMKQLISYAVGCWMGRYRLDKPGLHIAHPNPTDEEVCTYTYGDSKLTIDDDGIIPILSADSAFDDNLVQRVQEFIRIAFGAEKVNQNISFVEACLGTSLEKYLQKDFWKDHKKMYQNRPIYWLFSSKKGAFQCLAYMHRMDANTADKVRSNYLMKHMEWLRQSIAGLEANAIGLNTAERNKLKKLRNDLAECEEYNDRLQLIADKRIAFDLDDGVVINYAKFGDVLAKIK